MKNLENRTNVLFEGSFYNGMSSSYFDPSPLAKVIAEIDQIASSPVKRFSHQYTTTTWPDVTGQYSYLGKKITLSVAQHQEKPLGNISKDLLSMAELNSKSQSKDIFVLVYDTAQHKTYEDMCQNYELISEACKKNSVPIIILGIDSCEGGRGISAKRGRNQAEAWGVPFFEVSLWESYSKVKTFLDHVLSTALQLQGENIHKLQEDIQKTQERDLRRQEQELDTKIRLKTAKMTKNVVSVFSTLSGIPKIQPDPWTGVEKQLQKIVIARVSRTNSPIGPNSWKFHPVIQEDLEKLYDNNKKTILKTNPHLALSETPKADFTESVWQVVADKQTKIAI